MDSSDVFGGDKVLYCVELYYTLIARIQWATRSYGGKRGWVATRWEDKREGEIALMEIGICI